MTFPKFNFKIPGMWINRTIQKYLTDISEKRPCILLTGCRQSGKTSLFKKNYPNIKYVSLDIPLHAEEAENSGNEFLKKQGEPVIIDEIQYAPELMKYIKVKIDENRDENGRFFLTGSQKFSLMEGVSESLAGRIAIITLHSLSLFEIEKWTKVPIGPDLLLDLMIKGGFPELHSKDLSPEQFFGDYLATYLERDVRQIVNVKNLRDFDRFIRLLALRSGQLLSMNSLASDVGVSSHTIKSWINILEASNIIYLLEPYYKNLGKRIVKAPKMYFLDTGLLIYLLGIRTNGELQNSTLLGNIFETLTLGQIIRTYANHGKTPNLYYYRDHYGHEIDFIIPVGEKLKLIECKWSEKPELPHKGFLEIEKLIGKENILTRTIVTPNRKAVKMKEGVTLSNCVDMRKLLI